MKVKKKAKRFFAILMSLAMVVSMMPTIAFAADNILAQSTDKLYVKMTVAPKEGDKVIIADRRGDIALSASAEAANITVSDYKITSVGDAAVWTVSGSDSAMKFKNGDNYLYGKADFTLGVSGSGSKNTWTVSTTDPESASTKMTMYTKCGDSPNDWYLLGFEGFTLSTNGNDSNSPIAFYKEYDPGNITVTSYNGTYNAERHGVMINPSTAPTGFVYKYKTTGDTYSVYPVTRTDAGGPTNVTVGLFLDGTGIPQEAAAAPLAAKDATITIGKRDASIVPEAKTITKGDSVIFTADETELYGRDEGGGFLDYSFVISKNGEVVNAQPEELTVGTYTLSFGSVKNSTAYNVWGNYNLDTSGTATLTVEPIESDIKVESGSGFIDSKAGLEITGTDSNGKSYTNDSQAAAGKLTAKVLSKGDPITETGENGLNLEHNESIVEKFEVNLYMDGVKMNTGAKLNKKIQVQVPVYAADGSYVIAHWDGTKYTRLPDPGVVSGGILTFASDEFSPFVIIGSTPYVKMYGTPADKEGYTISINSTDTVFIGEDGTALSEQGKPFVFTVTAKTGYEIVSVTDNGAAMTGISDVYTIPAEKTNEHHTIAVTVQEAPSTYDVTYSKGVATGTEADPTDTPKTEGDLVKAADNPYTYDGYTFAGWKRSDNGAIVNAADTFNMPAMNIALTAQWSKDAEKYTVAYNGNGAAGTTDGHIDVSEFAVVTTKANGFDIPSGRIFAGWKSSVDGTVYAAGESFNMPGMNVVLTAQWADEAVKSDVTYNKGTIDVATVPGTASDQAAGTVITVGDEPTGAASGYTFVGYRSSYDQKVYQPGDTFVMPETDVKLTAQWADPEATYSVAYNLNGGTLDSAFDTVSGKKLNDDFTVSSTLPGNTGHTFLGWMRSDNGQMLQPNDHFNMPGMNITLTAQWKEIDKYTVTYNVDGVTTIDSTNLKAENEVYKIGEVVVTSEPSKEGFIFTGWRSSVDDVVYTHGAAFLMPAQNVTLIATWAAEDAVFEVTYDMNGASSAQITDDTKYKYAANVKVNNTVPTKENYTFAGWKRSDNGEIINAGDNINMPACNLVLTAQWNAVIKYTVNYELNGADTPSSITAGEFLGLSQAKVTEVEPTKTDYRFIGWLNKDTGIEYAKGETFTMPEENITLTAQWAKEYTVKFELGGGAGQNGNPLTIADQTVILGDKLTSVGKIKDYTVSGTPDVKYYFNGWKNQNGKYWSFDYDAVDAGCFDKDGIMTLTAEWDTEKTYNVVFDDNLDAPHNDYFYLIAGNLTKDDVPATSKLTYADYPIFNRVDYILGIDNTQNYDWYLDAACTYPYDVTGTLESNNVDVFASDDGTLTLYARWTAKYDEAGDVLMDADSLNTTGTYNTYYSDWVDAWEYTGNVLTEKTVPVYRNFYLISGSLPDGLNLNKRTGEIYGVPTKAGTYSFTLVMANDEVELISPAQSFTITIEPNTLSIDHKDITYDKTYGDVDPANLLKNYTNLTVSLSNTSNVAAGYPALSDLNSNVIINYTYAADNTTRTGHANDFTAAIGSPAITSQLKYAPDLAVPAPVIPDTLSDTLQAKFDRADGEDADTYKISMPKANVTGAAVTAGAYAVDIPEEFQAIEKAESNTAKYIFTINKVNAAIDIPDTADYRKVYGNDDGLFGDMLTMPAINFAHAGTSVSPVGTHTDKKVTIAFPVGFTDTLNVGYTRAAGEDAGAYKIYLLPEHITGVSINGVTADGAAVAAKLAQNYNFVIEADFQADTPVSGKDYYNFNIDIRDTTFTPDNATVTYGSLKLNDVVEGTFASEVLADNDTIGVKDTAVVKVADTNLSTGKYLNAGTSDKTAFVFAMTNGADPMGTADADTTENYSITTSLTVTKKDLTVQGQTVNVNNGSAPAAANIAALAKLEGVLAGDDVTLTVDSYTCGGNNYANITDLIAALGTITADKTVTVNYSGIAGTDAGNYSITAGSVDAALKAYTAPSGGGGGGGGAIIVPPTPAASGHAAYMQGDDLGYFRPDANMTRAEAATVFYNILTDKSMGEEPAVFTDVNSGDWYAKAVTTLASKGILGGYEDGSFQPSKSITRAEFVTIASRLKGMSNGSASFSDVPSTHWAYDYITSAASKGWITGYPDGTFKPEANIVRAEVVTLVNRVLERVPDKKFIDKNIDDIKVLKDVKKAHWAYYYMIEATNGHDYSRDSKGNETWERLK